MKAKKLLIVDDEKNMLHMLEALLQRHGYAIDTVSSAKEAADRICDTVYDFILCDVKMPEMDGLEFIMRYGEHLAKSTVIMMSAFGNIDLAVEALKAGAYDFISKPFKTDEVLLALRKAEEREELKRENRLLKSKLEIRGEGFKPIVGESAAIDSARTTAEKIAAYATSVLITGESGTGKELFARGIHEVSPRRNLPMYVINCGTLPHDLVESELFGYVKGAFTGADVAKKGLFEDAHGSTLFLDEVGELPPPVQVKLLRVLQEGDVRRLGDSKSIRVDVRVIAATNRDLEQEVASRAFRSDLFYRLNVFPLHIPPLRERQEDIPLLCRAFLDKYNEKLGRHVRAISDEAMATLLQYSWPGNVRELENSIQRAMVFCDTGTIEKDDLLGMSQREQKEAGEETYETFSIKEAQKQMEKQLISKALRHCQGNKSGAAILLAISYPTLLHKIKEYRLE